MKKITTLLLALILVVGAQAITVAEAITIGQALDHAATTTETYTIEGYVTVIEDNSFNTSWNNMKFWIADKRGTAGSTQMGAIQIYRGRPDRELVVGDKVQVVTQLKRWYETVESATNNAPTTWLEGPSEEVEDTIKGSLRVCAQNLENYYYNLNTGRGNYTQEEFVAKTQKIVRNMLAIDADIYAFCEVEAQPIVLQQLADSMNAHAGVAGRYAPVNDGISVTWSEEADYNIKSGFIYRTDKVATVGSSSGGTGGNGYYAHTMRIQTFKQLSNNEKLVVSMNHFKAKDSSADAGNSTRVTNATNLVNSLSSISSDPDKLVLGDLNCLINEDPTNIIVNAGYEEQLLKYDANAFSHCFNGGELIDHVFANSSMANQIVNAYVKHVSAYKCNAAVAQADSYSDHDPYVVEINLGNGGPSSECTDIDETYLTSEFGECTTDNTNVWSWNSYNYAKGSRSGGVTGHLFTPGYNMANMESVSLSFAHAHRFEADASQEYTLWVTSDYKGSFEDSEWQQLTINPYSPYANGKWNWADVNINVPLSYVGANTVFAFQYMSTTSNYGTWEIKNLHITATCSQSGTALEQAQRIPQATKIIENGQLILLLPDGTKYNVIGLKVK